jgi:hypothetical protein
VSSRDHQPIDRLIGIDLECGAAAQRDGIGGITDAVGKVGFEQPREALLHSKYLERPEDIARGVTIRVGIKIADLCQLDV